MECPPAPRRSRAAQVCRWLAVRLAALAALTLVVPIPWPEAPPYRQATSAGATAAPALAGRADFPPRSAPVPTTSTTTTTTAPPPTTEPPIPATTAPPAPTTTAPPTPAAPAPPPAPADPLAACIPAHALNLVPKPAVREQALPGLRGQYRWPEAEVLLAPGWDCSVVTHEWAHHLMQVITPRHLMAPDAEHVADCVAAELGHPVHHRGGTPAGYGCTPGARERARVLLQGRDPYPAPPPRYRGAEHLVPAGGAVTVTPPAGYGACAAARVTVPPPGISVRCAGVGVVVVAAGDAPVRGAWTVTVDDAAGWTWGVVIRVQEGAD